MTPDPSSRQALRQRLKSDHQAWQDSPERLAAQEAMSRHLEDLLMQLEPQCLGLYWPLPGEFDAREACLTWAREARGQLALPWALREPRGAMRFHLWKGDTPDTRDECGIVSPATATVQPDVLVVPCVGVTPEGWRLGYGGGYYDRYLAAHPHVTTVGVAWTHALLESSAITPEPHDQPMMLVVTPEGVVGGN